MKKTSLRLRENARTFKLKRKCILPQTHLRFNLNVKAFFSSALTFLFSTFGIPYLYSCQLLIWISFWFMWQNASMNALARRALVINGMLWSMAPRRMR